MATALSKGDDTKIRAEESESLSTKLSASSIVLSEEFNFADHAKNAFKVIESYFNDLWLTDVTLVTGNKRINVHRLVLSASSPYFATMFKSSFKESIQDEIEMKEIDGDALLALVQYCYTGSIKLREDNVQILFVTARLLQIDPVVEACSRFLIKQLDPCNCLGIRTIAEAQGCDSLSSMAHAYALEYFVQVVQNQEFLLLSADTVAEFLESEDVNVPSEETIFNALTTWLKHDSINRIKDASKLMSYVKLPLLTPRFIVDHIQGNELFNDQKAIQDLILEAFTYHLLNEPTDSLLKSGRTRPRKSTMGILPALGQVFQQKDDKGTRPRKSTMGILLALGEVPLMTYFQDSVRSPIEAFDLRGNAWEKIDREIEKIQFGAVCFKEKLFIVGGSIKKEPYQTTNTVECINLASDSQETWPSMQTCRRRVGVGILNGFLYAVGGYDDIISPLNTVERCDLATKKWSFVAPISTRRYNAGVAVLNNKLYVVGGGYGMHATDTMECYDPETNKWTFCSPMSRSRYGVGIGVLNGYIYVIGGSNFEEFFNYVERYDPKTDKWTMIAPMRFRRLYPGVGVLDHRLVVVGGSDGRDFLTSVEAYDPALNEWQELAPLPEGRMGPCVVVDRSIYKRY